MRPGDGVGATGYGAGRVASILDTLGPAAPAALVEALGARDASISRVVAKQQQQQIWADSSDGPLFARFSAEPRDHDAFAFEASARAVVGSTGDVRSPPVLDLGVEWLLERQIVRRPFGGKACIDRAVTAAVSISELDLPRGGAAAESRAFSLFRRLDMVRSSVPLGHVIASKRALRSHALPLVASHGDFHDRNLLYDGEKLWVIDWELAGPRPAGYDLMYLWATLEAEEDRELLFAAAREAIGQEHEQDLLRLRYGVAVAVAVNMLTTRTALAREAQGHGLVEMLPGLRREAALDSARS